MIFGSTGRSLLMFLATLSVGLMAGTFALYAHTLMPGLGKTDDRTFVGAFQAIDRAIINPWFIGGTFGSAFVFTLLATISLAGTEGFRWVLAALVCYGLAVLVTFLVHVPLNNAIKAVGDLANVADVTAVRRQFNEQRWAAWNLVRVISSLAAFALLLKARG